MIPYFPAPRPDELVFSLIARYSHVMAYANPRHIAVELFGNSQTTAAGGGLPGRLRRLQRAFPGGYPVENEQALMVGHTLLPYYAAFLPPGRAIQIQRMMAEENGQAIRLCLGITAGQVRPPQWWRYCPQCAREERQQYEDGCYWHRSHQLPGVLVCPSHLEPLRDSAVAVFHRRNRHVYIAAEQAVPRDLSAILAPCPWPEACRPALETIARDTAWLLAFGLSLPHLFEQLGSRYRQLLAAQNLATPTGHIRVRLLMQAFNACYSPDVLELVGCRPPMGEDNWLVRLVRRPERVQPPLHHLLLLHCLGQEAAEFFTRPARPAAPFGEGPWPCLNPVCADFHQPVIDQAAIHFSGDSHRPVGVFACQCGFIYSRVGPDAAPADRLRLSRVEQYGPRWEEVLRQKWLDPAVSLRGLARQLAVDPRTVKQQALRLGLAYPRPGHRGGQRPEAGEQCAVQPGADVTVARQEWLALQSAHPQAGNGEWRRLAPALYSRLYRSDRAWLAAQSPPCRKRPMEAPRVDWAARDRLLAEEIQRQPLPDAGRLRLSRAELARQSGHPDWLEKRAGRLPLTREVLARRAESRLAFALRRINRAVQHCRAGGERPLRWQFIRLAGLGRVAGWPEVKAAIDQAMAEIGF